MAVLKGIPRDSQRTQPLVWVRRVVVFESLDPRTVIWDVPLGTGLNIVWGIEEERGDGEERFEPGHGVGKTTFCRLIRFCLGESTFGQEHAAREIRFTFAEGYVAAEIQIQGQVWAVLRPFDRHKSDCARAGVSIEELLDDRPPRASFTGFRAHLAQVCLDGIRIHAVLTGGASILWDHVLAMCSRDQEARYQSLWNWRSTRSASGTPAFKQPKVDALLCLRAVLGLLPQEETDLQQRLQRLADEISDLDEEIGERRREPEFWDRRLRRSLQDDLGIENASRATLDSDDMFGLPRVIERRIEELEQERTAAAAELTPLERQISLAASALLEPAELQDQQAAAADATNDGTANLLQEIEELLELRQSIADARFSWCKYGQISIGKCSYAQAQLADSDRRIRDSQEIQLPISSRRDETAAALAESAQRVAEGNRRLREQLNALHSRRNELLESQRTAKDAIGKLRTMLGEIERWDAIRSGRLPDSELARLVARREQEEGRERDARAQLSALLSAQDQRSSSVREMYETLVTQTLSPEFHGRVRLSSDGLEFQIFRGENLSGEAFETLSLLLADLSVLLMGGFGQVRHPGFLIHDSPREADLGDAIYRRLLQCVAEISIGLRGSSEAPFQYIVTTTTPPPPPLRGPDITRLTIGGHHGPLFGRQLHAALVETQGDLLTEVHLRDEGGVE